MDHLTYVSFYEPDPVAMSDWTNLAHDWDLGLILNAAELGVPLLPDVAAVFFFRPFVLDDKGQRGLGRLALRPDYMQAWKAFASLIRPLVQKYVVAGFFLGDELMWNGAHPDEIRSAAALIAATFSSPSHGQPMMIYLNEYTDVFLFGTNVFRMPVAPDANGNTTSIQLHDIPITHISIDQYSDPSEVEGIYRTYIYPRMNPAQRAFLVPQAYASVYDPWQSCDDTISQAQQYLEWARRDPNIVGLNPWHWFSYQPFGCRPVDGNGARIHSTIGVRDLPPLREWWTNAGRQILASHPSTRIAPSQLSLLHDFNDFANGERLPSTFAVDHTGRGGQGTADPEPPAVDDVAFSTDRGGRTSIFMKHPTAAFRYSWGTVPRVFEGIQWISPRSSRQTLKFNMWFDNASAVSLSIKPDFGGHRIAAINLGSDDVRPLYRSGEWNDIEIVLDLNTRAVLVTINGVSARQRAMEAELTASEILFEGGPVFISAVELRSWPHEYVRGYRNACEGVGPAVSLHLTESRVGLIDASTEAYVKDFGILWLWQAGQIANMALDGSRVGVLKRDGNVFVKDGALAAEWTWESSNVQALVLEGLRIGVLHTDDNVFVKDGSLDAEWVWQSSNVQALVLEGSRIGVLHDGNVFVKDGPLDAEWTWQSSNVQALVLEGSRVGVLHTDDNVFVKDGSLDAEWVWQSSNVQALVLEGSRIGVLHNDGNVFVKDGPLDAEWIWQSSHVKAVVLSGEAIGVIHESGLAYLKRGDLDATWLQLNGSTLG